MEVMSSPPIYHTSSAQKMRSKNAAHRFKYGSPKLVEMMREKCRLRIKEARNEQIFRKRNIVQEEKALLESIVRQELSELEKDIELQELIFQELISETNEWLFEEYEKSETYMINGFDQEAIFCPVCQKNEIGKLEAGLLQCLCGIKIRFSGSIEQFAINLKNTIAEHEIRCAAKMQFFLEPVLGSDAGQLNAYCPVCDYCKMFTD
ncbi:RIP-like protein [Toxorhynchites rutilus septentrionalis]|uniref:RIP-like protein n=1 Tax=Toxorhynchites rutilus septentrionalis TaxID=329112 RepID=UPI0024796C43|nr:RIP-like protein [Toxorhynchites rutilus septentrionalis]